jgi:hypothetical protein
MVELGLTEELAQTIVDRCTEEAKLVAVEQEAKKAAEARAKAADAALLAAGMKGVGGEAFASPMLPQTAAAAVTTEEAITPGGDETGRMPLAMEATEGIAPELTTHSEGTFSGGGGTELSPEERAISGITEGSESGAQATEVGRDDENEETAALAEGRVAPPASGEQA